MATTKLWHISGRLKDLVDYVENPDKTIEKFPELSDLVNAARYVQRPEATSEGQYVTAINCLKETAIEQMILTKKQYGKTDGYIAFHGYQSFQPGEVTPKECHEIGVALAKQMWGDRFQILVTTHLDKDHLHNHFCINSVSFKDGGKYNYSKKELQRLRDTSDRLCIQRGLSIIEDPKRAPHRVIYLAEKNGEPTRYRIYREDLYDAINGSQNTYMIELYLNMLGYETDFTGKHWKIKLPQYAHFTRLDTLDERLTPAQIVACCGYDARDGNRMAKISHPPNMPEHIKKAWVPHRKPTGIYALFIRYCYELGVLPKKTTYRPTSPFLREELRKADRIDEMTRFLGKTGIEHVDQLYERMSTVQARMDDLTDERTHITYRMRRADPEKKEELKTEKEDLTKEITRLREELRLMMDIERRALSFDKTMQRVHESELRMERLLKEHNERVSRMHKDRDYER